MDRVEYIYKCNCIKNDRRVTNSKRIVKVDKEGVCNDCGFYAVVEKKIYSMPTHKTGVNYRKKDLNSNHKNRPLTVYSLETLEKVGVYESITECARKLNIKYSTVSQHFTDQLIQTKGYIILKGYDVPIPISRLEKMNKREDYRKFLVGKISFINLNSVKGVKHIEVKEI